MEYVTKRNKHDNGNYILDSLGCIDVYKRQVKTYNVTPSTADPTSATLTSTDPYHWTNPNNITVTAWWPYTAGETIPPAVKVKANESAQKDFEGSDLIVADGQTVTYGCLLYTSADSLSHTAELSGFSMTRMPMIWVRI